MAKCPPKYEADKPGAPGAASAKPTVNPAARQL
jgi:hypothetical protein